MTPHQNSLSLSESTAVSSELAWSSVDSGQARPGSPNCLAAAKQPSLLAEGGLPWHTSELTAEELASREIPSLPPIPVFDLATWRREQLALLEAHERYQGLPFDTRWLVETIVLEWLTPTQGCTASQETIGAKLGGWCRHTVMRHLKKAVGANVLEVRPREDGSEKNRGTSNRYRIHSDICHTYLSHVFVTQEEYVLQSTYLEPKAFEALNTSSSTDLEPKAFKALNLEPKAFKALNTSCVTLRGAQSHDVDESLHVGTYNPGVGQPENPADLNTSIEQSLIRDELEREFAEQYRSANGGADPPDLSNTPSGTLRSLMDLGASAMKAQPEAMKAQPERRAYKVKW
jgi:hypothetical protein